MKKICIIKFSALGDLSAIEPFLICIKKKYDFNMLTSKIGYEYYKNNKNINKFHILESKNLSSILKSIFDLWNEYDYIIDLQGNDRSTFISKMSFVKYIISNRASSFKIKDLTIEEKRFIKEYSSYHLYSSILFPFIKEFNFLIPSRINNKNYIVINAGASFGWESKHLPLNKWKEIGEVLLDKFNMEFYFTGSNEEYKYIQTVFDVFPGKKKNIAGKTSLIELQTVLEDAFLTVATDSGPMHISSVKGTPTIGIFGPTNWIKSAPFGPWSTVVYDKIYFKDGKPLEKNSREIDNYFDNIDISESLDSLSKYLK